MNELIVDRYLKLITPLPIEVKLELISKIFDQLKSNISQPEINKEELLDELYGSWKDVDDTLIDDIFLNRSSSDRQINLDE